MSENIYDILEALFEKSKNAENMLISLLGEDWAKKISSGEFSMEAHKYYQEYLQVRKEIVTCIKPTTIIPRIEKEEDADVWKDTDNIYSYPILDYLKRARDLPEMNTFGEDDLDPEDFEDALTKLINFRYFNPNQWFKKEGEFPPVHIKGEDIPTWLSDRYKEAVYSYVYGFNNAAVALCRSIVEGIINDKFGHKIHKSVELKYKIDFIMNAVKDTKEKQVAWSAHEVRTTARDVLHNININRSCNESTAKKRLLQTRNFISILY